MVANGPGHVLHKRDARVDSLSVLDRQHPKNFYEKLSRKAQCSLMLGISLMPAFHPSEAAFTEPTMRQERTDG